MNILVVAAHPDDEVLGCGGTMAKHIQAGDHVKVVIMADGVTSRLYGDILQRRAECERANLALGVSDITLLSYPDNRIGDEFILQIAKDIETINHEFKADMVYTHSQADLNLDHRTVGQAVITAFRPPSGAAAILCFEILSSTEWGLSPFRPNWFDDISSTWEAKLEAMRRYESELRSFPHPRSLECVESLGRLRGSAAGCYMAEAFELYRAVQ